MAGWSVAWLVGWVAGENEEEINKGKSKERCCRVFEIGIIIRPSNHVLRQTVVSIAFIVDHA